MGKEQEKMALANLDLGIPFEKAKDCFRRAADNFNFLNGKIENVDYLQKQLNLAKIHL